MYLCIYTYIYICIYAYICWVGSPCFVVVNTLYCDVGVSKFNLLSL